MTLPVDLFIIWSFTVSQSQQVIHTGFIKLSQGNQGGTGNIQSAALISGVGRLADIKQFCNLLLRQVVIFSQIFNVLIQYPHLMDIVLYAIIAY
jgi:hypothetical protein